MRLLDFFQIDVSSLTDKFRANSKVILLTACSVIFIMCAAFVLVFFLALQGGERVMVPAVEGKDLSVALLEMQAKELYPRIQLRYSDHPDDRGRIIEQDPGAGSIVKAGRRISLVVSRGVIIERVENYVGQNIDDVRMNLQTLFTAGSVPLLSVAEPVLYQFSQEPAGTILEQDPPPDTSITEPIQMTFVVSRGAENDQIYVPAVTGRSIAEIIAMMEQTDLIFNFSARLPQGDETAGTVVSQLPAGETRVPKFSVVDAVLAVPAEAPSGFVYGIFREELPEYPYPFQITLDVISPSGERREYISVRHPGGTLSVPYLLPEGSVISLRVLNREAGLYEISPVSADAGEIAGTVSGERQTDNGAGD